MTKPIEFSRKAREGLKKIFTKLGISPEDFLGDFSVATKIFDIENAGMFPFKGVKTFKEQIEQLQKFLNKELENIEKPQVVKLGFMSEEDQFFISIPKSQLYLFPEFIKGGVTSALKSEADDKEWKDFTKEMEEFLKEKVKGNKSIFTPDESFPKAFKYAVQETLKRYSGKEPYLLEFPDNPTLTLKSEFLRNFLDRLGYVEESRYQYRNDKISKCDEQLSSAVDTDGVFVRWGNDEEKNYIYIDLNKKNIPTNIKIIGDIDIRGEGCLLEDASFEATRQIYMESTSTAPQFKKAKFKCNDFKAVIWGHLKNEGEAVFTDCTIHAEKSIKFEGAGGKFVSGGEVVSNSVIIVVGDTENCNITAREMLLKESALNQCNLCLEKGNALEQRDCVQTEAELSTNNKITRIGKIEMDLEIQKSFPPEGRKKVS